MTALAHNAAMLEISVDPLRLYHADPDAVSFIETVVDQVFQTRDRIAKGG